MLYYATYEQLWEGGALYTSIGWIPPADFDMQSRLWHQNAVKDQTKVCYTEPYVDANTVVKSVMPSLLQEWPLVGAGLVFVLPA